MVPFILLTRIQWKLEKSDQSEEYHDGPEVGGISSIGSFWDKDGFEIDQVFWELITPDNELQGPD